MRFTTIGLAGMLAMAFALSTCAKKEGDDTGLLVGLAAVHLQQKEKEAANQAAVASSGLQSALGGVGGTSFAFLEGIAKERLLAHARQMLVSQTQPRAIATAYTCQDGTCNKGVDEILMGTTQCLGGSGSATANNVKVNMDAASTTGNSYNISMNMNGTFTFSSCKVIAHDYSKLPTLSLHTSAITGDVTVLGGWAASVSIANLDIHSSSTSNTKYTSSNLVVDGVPVAIEVKDTSSFTSSATGGSPTGLTYKVSGTIRLNGAVNGTNLALEVPVDSTMTCTISGGSSISCN